VLRLDDSPGRAVDIFDAGAAPGAFIGVDDIAVFALGDGFPGTFVKTGTTLDAVFGDFISHGGILVRT
jgi:hypothetical protein